MKTITVMSGQTLADIAIQEFGAFEAVCDIAKVNGIPMSSVLSDGCILKIPDRTYNAKMENYCATNIVSPATDVLNNGYGIFTKEFTKEYV